MGKGEILEGAGQVGVISPSTKGIVSSSQQTLTKTSYGHTLSGARHTEGNKTNANHEGSTLSLSLPSLASPPLPHSFGH
jgi:hypothetical protein